MKNLFSVFFCLLAAIVAQQVGESKSSSQVAPPNIQPSSDILVRALLAADRAESKQEKIPAEEFKTLIDREIAKSATFSSARVTRPRQGIHMQPADLLVTIDGAVYLKFGGTIYPMPGGGASGCFDPNSSVRLEQARLKFAEQRKSEEGKK